MSMISMPVGQEDFKQLRENKNLIYIDKTYFIKEWWESNDKVTIITRPRCFGKSLIMSMVDYFFSNQYVNTQYLFKDLFISEKEHVMCHQGQFPVIHLNFGDMKRGDSESIKDQVKMKIWQTYLIFKKDMLESENLDITEKKFIDSITYQMNDHFAVNSIQCLCNFLSKVYNNKESIILLDNYDSIYTQNIIQNRSNESFSEVNDFFMSFISATFKNNKFMLKGLMAGVLNIPLSSTFSGLNNINVYTMTNGKYSDCFGFTKNEVVKLTNFFQINSKSEEIERWYDGYTFGELKDLHIFNPNSVSHFFNNSNRFLTYSFMNSNNEFIKELLIHCQISEKDDIIRLIQRETIQKELKENNLIENYNDKSEENFWAFLLSIGYLTSQKVDDLEDGSRIVCNLKIPNEEIIEAFSGIINEWFRTNNFFMNKFVDALLTENLISIEKFMNNFINLIFCTYQKDSIFHLFALGLTAHIRKDFYVILSENNEDGIFYFALKSLNTEKCPKSFIFEFKKKIAPREKNQVFLQYEIIKQKFLKKLEDGFTKEDIKEISFSYTNNECKINYQIEDLQLNIVEEGTNKNDDNNNNIVLLENNHNTNNNNNNATVMNNVRIFSDKVPNFDYSHKTQLRKNDKIFVIDKNQYDIYEAILIKRENGFNYVRYPDYPGEDEKILGVRRILAQTPRNINIFRNQEKLRSIKNAQNPQQEVK